MTTPPPSTTDQILIKLGEMGIQLAHIEERVTAVSDHETRLRDIESKLPPNLEVRLGTLETARAKLAALATVLALVASAAGTWVGLIIAHH